MQKRVLLTRHCDTYQIHIFHTFLKIGASQLRKFKNKYPIGWDRTLNIERIYRHTIPVFLDYRIKICSCEIQRCARRIFNSYLKSPNSMSMTDNDI